MKKWFSLVVLLALVLAAAALVVALQPEPEARGSGAPLYYGSFVANDAKSHIDLWNGAKLSFYSDKGKTRTLVLGGDDLVADTGTFTTSITTGEVNTSGDANVGGELKVTSGGVLAGTYVLADGAKLDTQSGTEEGVVFAVMITTTYQVTTTEPFVIPANADVVDYAFITSTAYDDTGTDLMECGPADDQDKFVDDLDLSSAGRIMAMGNVQMQLDEMPLGDIGDDDMEVQCVYTGQNDNAANGAGVFILWYRGA